ncbi:hypothetical protein ASE40_02895 [Flavobacterium sp. Root935]|jgi:hypothetical protein|uniref:hypothetical protein n=1 Tax=unclassified Flavobacterium TaxID=196869 RepID=UPI00070A1D13|nr:MULTISPECIES: hypothetical protein [unclassified Flavobacterium]KRD62753.1 hypothetical protein ASE40_02895 [Flavobacterium sp. Root935]MDQ1167949.1 hypothetical protein [Flavobacterium sp. SORGH_AS_0622]
MKQIFLFLSIIFSTVSISQTVLTSYPIDFKNVQDQCELLNAENTTTHDVFAFIASPNNFTILKYNSAFFLKDQFVTSRQYVENRSLLGYSFSEDGNPTVYWLSPEQKDIIVIKYYFENKTTRALKFALPVDNQSIVTQYQKDNNFYLLMKYKDKQALTAYIFKNGMAEERFLDFSPFIFRDRKTQQKTFNQILNENPIEKMDSGEYNPLFKVVAKTKLYTLPNRLILTLDQSLRKTQLFDINLDNLEIKEKTFMQPLGHKNARTSNSFYHENKLYQFNVNSDELLFDIKDYDSGELIKTFTVSKNDTIRFNNSPLLMQIENRQPKEIKKTSKFLKELASVDAGLSVFKNKKNLFITLGGTGSDSKAISMNGFNMFDDFFGDFPPRNYYIESNYSVFFESVWTKKLELTTEKHEPLASDKIYYFMDTHKEVSLPNILKLNNYSILGYYNITSKEYVLRKFTDGFD